MLFWLCENLLVTKNSNLTKLATSVHYQFLYTIETSIIFMTKLQTNKWYTSRARRAHSTENINRIIFKYLSSSDEYTSLFLFCILSVLLHTLSLLCHRWNCLNLHTWILHATFIFSLKKFIKITFCFFFTSFFLHFVIFDSRQKVSVSMEYSQY